MGMARRIFSVYHRIRFYILQSVDTWNIIHGQKLELKNVKMPNYSGSTSEKAVLAVLQNVLSVPRS